MCVCVSACVCLYIYIHVYLAYQGGLRFSSRFTRLYTTERVSGLAGLGSYVGFRVGVSAKCLG